MTHTNNAVRLCDFYVVVRLMVNLLCSKLCCISRRNFRCVYLIRCFSCFAAESTSHIEEARPSGQTEMTETTHNPVVSLAGTMSGPPDVVNGIKVDHEVLGAGALGEMMFEDSTKSQV